MLNLADNTSSFRNASIQGNDTNSLLINTIYPFTLVLACVTFFTATGLLCGVIEKLRTPQINNNSTTPSNTRLVAQLVNNQTDTQNTV